MVGTIFVWNRYLKLFQVLPLRFTDLYLDFIKKQDGTCVCNYIYTLQTGLVNIYGRGTHHHAVI